MDNNQTTQSADSSVKISLPTAAPQPAPEKRIIPPASPSLVQRFRELVTKVRKDTAHLSVIDQKVEHPAFREIVGMGWPSVPLLLAELRRKPGFWFVALHEITQENPVLPDDDGDIAAISRAWVEWGKAQGYLE